jgi:hypothetical protein
MDLNIYYFTPARGDKNLGKAFNDHCRLVPNDNDWIVLRDGDSMFVQTDYAEVIEKALALDGHKFGLIGCYTNRLRGLHQLHDRKFSNNHDVNHHWEIAKEYKGKEGIEDLKDKGVAGVFMAFQKKTWKLAGGFAENSIVCDTNLNLKVRKLRLRIGLIRGLYIYHAYRPWNFENAPDDIKHLK